MDKDGCFTADFKIFILKLIYLIFKLWQKINGISWGLILKKLKY